jgi:ATP synthase F1 complex assembly factor 1
MHKSNSTQKSLSKSHSKPTTSKRTILTKKSQKTTTTITKKSPNLTKSPLTHQNNPFSTTSAGSNSSLGFSWPVSKKLDGVVNLERFALENSSVIDQLWSDYHAASSTATGFSIDSSSFEKLKQRGPNTSFFIHPIPRPGGYFVMLSQYQDKSFLITYLEDFKTNPMNAQPYMTITLYDELQHSKDMVFVRSDICALATLNKEDADHLARTVVNSYCDDGMYTNVWNFNKQPDAFKFDEYVNQIVTNSQV